MRRQTALGLGFALLASLPLVAADSHWPQFRGPAAGVVPDDPALPERWSTTENVLWQTAIPGTGWSSPIVWGDHIFVTSAVTADAPPARARVYTAAEVAPSTVPHRWVLYDVSLKTGRIRWQRELAADVPAQPKHMKNSFASETPATDGTRVYAWLGNAGLFAFDMAGRPLWSKPSAPVRTRSGWGSAASPVVHQGRVYVLNDNEDQSWLAAFDGKSGAELWRVPRDEKSGWSTPYIWSHAGRTELITIGSKKVRSYALDGRLLWELSGLTTLNIPTAFAADGLLYINSGFRVESVRPVYAIRPGASGDISLKPGETSNSFVAWSHPTLGSYNPSSIVYRGAHYTLYDTSFLASHDARTGQEIYPRQRLSADSTGFTASPWAYNGRLFALSEDGDTFVIQAGPEFKVLARNPLDEMTLATPAIAGRSLVIRTASKLYRIGTRR